MQLYDVFYVDDIHETLHLRAAHVLVRPVLLAAVWPITNDPKVIIHMSK